MVPLHPALLATLLVLGLVLPTVGAFPPEHFEHPATGTATSTAPTPPATATEAFRLATTLAGLDTDAIVQRAEATREGLPTAEDLGLAYDDLIANLVPYGVVDTTDAGPDPAVPPTAWSDLPRTARTGLAILLDGLADATRLHSDAVERLDTDAAARLDAAWRASRASGDRSVLAQAFDDEGGLPAGLDRAGIAASAYRVLLAVDDARPHLEAAGQALRDGTESWLDDGVRTSSFCVEDPTTLVIVCSITDDFIDGDHILELDLGGDDTHAGNAGAAGLDVLWAGNNGFPVALALDVAGSDSYSGGDTVQAAGSTASGILVDLVGHDRYFASDAFFTFAQGAGNLGGVGFLHDVAGGDTYRSPGLVASGGDPAWDTQGFGILGGLGILFDPLEEDVYAGGAMAQGVGDFQALGLHLDTDGHDIRSAERLAQGFADGLGVGASWDGRGDDRYSMAGPYGQGAAIGGYALMLDAEGDDDYFGSGSARGHGATGPAWKPIDDLLSTVGIEPVGGAVFVDLVGADSYAGGPGCDTCAWLGGTGGVGLDVGP